MRFSHLFCPLCLHFLDCNSEQTKPNSPVVTAKRPNHVWHVDLTVVPILRGAWAAWLPGALPQCLPFCW